MDDVVLSNTEIDPTQEEMVMAYLVNNHGPGFLVGLWGFFHPFSPGLLTPPPPPPTLQLHSKSFNKSWSSFPGDHDYRGFKKRVIGQNQLFLFFLNFSCFPSGKLINKFQKLKYMG